MVESEGISIEALRVLVERAGMQLTEEELADLLPIYERYVRQTAVLHELDLGMGDLGVTFLPGAVPGHAQDLSR